MAKDVVMPALGMAQETGTLLKWLKAPGETVTKGEPLMEVETDKTVVEVEAPASGILMEVTARPGDVIPVGQRIAVIAAPGEAARGEAAPRGASAGVTATPVAARIAREHGLDLAQIKPEGGRVHKEDVLAFIAAQSAQRTNTNPGRVPASPKARRLAQERGLDLHALTGSGPDGAVLAADVLAAAPPPVEAPPARLEREVVPEAAEALALSRMWRVMVERLSQAWTATPHFYLMREVDATRLKVWREHAQKRSAEKITYTDLLVKVLAYALRRHPRLNAAWRNGTVVLNREINIGLAVAVEEGLIVPVIHNADGQTLEQLAARRRSLIERAQAGRLSPDELSGGTFTLSNLGMYGVDAFNAIVNPPQAAILAVGRIADRVVPVNGHPAVLPMLTLTLSCDHRVADGARAAQFLQTLVEALEEPLHLLE
ncbi:MAG: dihydrolipoamide acetyltransferase family protein [Anaerolineales bacterium]|nr:dihydrolipoamide acetyltransferase family protein [Anaerolineales bacterium]